MNDNQNLTTMTPSVVPPAAPPASPEGGGGTVSINQLLEAAIQHKASDLHIVPGVPPTLRVDGELVPLDYSVLKNEDSEALILNIIDEDKIELLKKKKKEVDFSFAYKDFRYRANVYLEQGGVCGSLRLLPNVIKPLSELGVPPIIEKFTEHSQGLVVITGPTGHGKSTTLASMIDTINAKRHSHIITVEDPVEYVFEHKKSIVSQREVGSDTESFSTALRAALREDPDVVLVGEMRDLESVEAAITIAETGHLVLTTLHTNSASQTTDRIVDVFPEEQQQQIRTQLASVILGIVSQRLIPRVSGGRILASEVMVANSAVRATIRDGKTHQLPNIIQTSAAEGMISLDKVLAEYVNNGEITIDNALTWAQDPKSLKMLLY